MKKRVKYFIFCMIFVAYDCPAQQIPLERSIYKGFTSSTRSGVVIRVNQNVEKTAIDPKFYTKSLGFFCKQELKLQALTKLPLFFRLGSLQYCDRMEGKLNAGALSAY